MLEWWRNRQSKRQRLFRGIIFIVFILREASFQVLTTKEADKKEWEEIIET